MLSKEKNNDVGKSYAERIKELRKKNKLTLEQLARMSNLSASFISLLERRKAVPSIVSLINIAKAFDVDVSYFLAPPDAHNIYHSASDPEYYKVDSPVTFIKLSPGSDTQKMESFIFIIPPNIILPREKFQGECFYYQLEGELHFIIGEDTYDMSPGDSLHFDSELGFLIQNNTNQNAKVLWVAVPPLFSHNRQYSTA